MPSAASPLPSLPVLPRSQGGAIAAATVAFVAGCWFFHVGVDRALGRMPRPTV